MRCSSRTANRYLQEQPPYTTIRQYLMLAKGTYLMQDTALVVMSAGIGSRFGGLKQLAPVGPNGEITVAYSAHDALRAGFNRVVFIIRRDMEQAFRERIGRQVQQVADTAYVHQELEMLPAGFTAPPGREKPWGTGHAVLCCREAVRQPFAVINADDFYGRHAFQLLHDFLIQPQAARGAPEYCMAGYRLDRTLSPHGHVSRGVCRVGPDGHLLEVVERTKIQRVEASIRAAEWGGWVVLPPDSIVSLNAWGFTAALFPDLEGLFVEFLKRHSGDRAAEFHLPGAVHEMIRAGRAQVRVLPTTAEWHGVTYREDLPDLRRAVQALTERGEYAFTANDE